MVGTIFSVVMAHTGSVTTQQVNALLNFLDEHRDLARGRLRSLDGKVRSRRLWIELCNTLNTMGGCTKTVKQWQKVWFDRKYLAKKAIAEYRRSATETTDGLPLSHWESRVLTIMGNSFAARQREPSLSETDEPMPSTSSQRNQSASYSEPLSLDLIKQEQSDPLQLPCSATQHQEPTTSRQYSQTTHHRRRLNMRGRVCKNKEERNASDAVRNIELAGIRSELTEIKSALLQLCGLFKEHLDRS